MADNRRRTKKKIPIRKTVIILLAVAVLGLIFLIAGGGAVFRSQASREAEIQENVKVLKEMETKKPVKEEETKPSGNGDSKKEPQKPADLTGEEEKIMSLDPDKYNNALTRKWFEDAVILGDSLSLAAAEYGYLDYDVVMAAIGASLETSDEQFNMAIDKNPSVVFMFYGGNDISAYLGEPQKFIDQYKAALKKLKGALPDATFYLHGILPEQKGVGYEEGYEYREDYNKALEEYCETLDNVYYINADFILEKDPGLYDADGIHPVSAFYPKWLTYLADVSGLSAEENDN